MKASKVLENGIWQGQVMFDCPGCECSHSVNTHSGGWGWNQSLEQPTFTPSVKVTWPQHNKPDRICHSFVTDGSIQFLTDCTHSLAGQKVPLPDSY